MIWIIKKFAPHITISLLFLIGTIKNGGGWVVTIFFGGAVLIVIAIEVYKEITDPFITEDQGFITAVDIAMDPKDWLRSDDPSLQINAIIRLFNGEELSLSQGQSLPKAARRQVFSPSFFIFMTPWTVNLAIPDKEAKRLAMEQVKQDKYRFDLPEHVPVTIQRSKKGRERIVGT